MDAIRTKTLSPALLLTIVLATLPAESQRRRPSLPAPIPIRACSTNICSTTLPSTCVEMNNAETAWRTCISNQGRRGLVLGPTDLRRTPTGEWMRVLREAGVADIFVPYHELTFLRLYDYESTNFGSVREVDAADAGPTGVVLTLSGQSIPQVVAETADRGIAWLCKENRSISRRGQELVLWAVQDAANYDFIIEYRLRDDGSIGFRLGATGFNNPYYPPRSTTDAHMHDVLWRVDVDLNGPANDSAVQFRHVETPPALAASDVEEPFNGGREGAVPWDPHSFFTIGVEDSTVNAFGHRIGYALRVSASGLSRHYGEQAGLVRKERFTQTDFAVTTFKQVERDLLYDNTRYVQPDLYLLGQDLPGFGVSDNESTNDTDIVLWHHTSTHHQPHDEDHAPGDSTSVMTGITNVHWQGFDLEPHNLFDSNPLGGPGRSQCQ